MLSPPGQHISHAFHAGRWIWTKLVKDGCPTSNSNLGTEVKLLCFLGTKRVAAVHFVGAYLIFVV